MEFFADDHAELITAVTELFDDVVCYQSID
jgi:hypothetical protein